MVRKNSGITLIEIMAVIGIIALLAAVVTPAALNMMKKAYIKKAQAMLTQIEGALALYYNDWGYYPSTGILLSPYQYNGNRNTTGSLVDALTQTEKSGPYISLKKDDLDSTGDIILDPWGLAYVYVARMYVGAGGTLVDVDISRGPFWPNTSDLTRNTYNIYSFGPNGATETTAGTDVTDPNNANAINSSYGGNNSTTDGASYDKNDDDINNWSQQE